jgi:tight adherence protein B
MSMSVLAFYGMIIYSKYFGITKLKARKKIREVLQAKKTKSIEINLLRQSEINSIFSEWVRKLDTQVSRNLEVLIIQSGVKINFDKFFILSSALFFSGLIIFTFLIIGSFVYSILPSLFLLITPYLYIQYKAKKRNEKFALQFPEGVDFLARSLKSGQAITASFGMLAEDFKEPLGPEFRQVFDEINYGLPFNQALGNLSTRNSNVDLNFFMVALMIQRESGGNLIELLTNLSALIRERSKMHGRIKNLSAEGRMSGWILVVMPFALIGIISIVNHQYISVLWENELGRKMLMTTGLMMLVGMFWIKRLVTIRV